MYKTNTILKIIVAISWKKNVHASEEFIEKKVLCTSEEYILHSRCTRFFPFLF